MLPKFKKEKRRKVVGQIRQTQLITTFGCGSVVDLLDNTVIIAGTDFWDYAENPSCKDKYIIYEENLQKLLGVEHFILPKIEDRPPRFPGDYSHDIPAFRFPEFMYCPSCHRLIHYRRISHMGKLRCFCKKRTNLVPARFILACENGHLEDFPYYWWVHRGKECKSPKGKQHNISLLSRPGTSGLEGLYLICNDCSETRSMKSAFRPNALKDYHCSGNMPWLRKKDEKTCDKVMRPLLRSAVSVYYGVTHSALTIPPWSSRIQQLINAHAGYLFDFIDDDYMLKNFIERKILYKNCGFTVEDVIKQLRRKDKARKTKEVKEAKNILEDEYKALCNEIDDEEFKTQFAQVPAKYAEYIDSVVLVKKLKEVMALIGFKRIKPFIEGDTESGNIAPLSSEKKNWYPAVELRGEGIFIKFNYEKIKEWEERIGKRYELMKENMEKSIRKTDKYLPHYVLLHTISHILIRQLTLQCGYSSAALKERIYSSFDDEQENMEMAGILIYTASPDSEGSLGGLVRQGEPERFQEILDNMLEEAKWCSSDPLCINMKSQGAFSLNYAACHSCALLPETSCEIANSFLDRAAVVGTIEDRNLGFFEGL